ncbi:hypothetical protein SDC9_155716 [bioreactor metagenome]|uniref:Uncharacterized protein n=1 Tax=bioreactor metagenome TaxID=1076179 RepID=A0A645F739_9ZZZZ
MVEISPVQEIPFRIKQVQFINEFIDQKRFAFAFILRIGHRAGKQGIIHRLVESRDAHPIPGFKWDFFQLDEFSVHNQTQPEYSLGDALQVVFDAQKLMVDVLIGFPYDPKIFKEDAESFADILTACRHSCHLLYFPCQSAYRRHSAYPKSHLRIPT